MTLPETMTAIAVKAWGGPEMLVHEERSVPRPEDGEVLIRVAAAGVNRPDILQRKGLYAPPPGASDIPGLEVAGTVAAVGKDAGPWREGDDVVALLAGGGYAEYCVAPGEQVLPLPRGLSMTQGAGLPETVFTVWANVFEIGRLGAGERLLVHGGTSGIGTTAIMLGVAFGAEVFVTAGTDGKCAFAEELGARAAINYREKDFVTEVERLVGREGIDVVLDMVGGDYIARNIALLRRGGRHLSIAFLSGSRVEVNFAPVLMRNLTLTGSVLRPRSREEKGRLAGKIAEKVWPLVETGRVTPVIDSTFPLSSAAQAHRRMESSAHMGKIVLVV